MRLAIDTAFRLTNGGGKRQRNNQQGEYHAEGDVEAPEQRSDEGTADAADTKTGFYEKARAIKEAAYWITEPSADYTRAGIAIYNIQNDYYNADAIYPCVKEAINIMNPSPRK